MSGSPNMHGWTHRPASEGGTDPIPRSPYTYASLFLSSSVDVDDTRTYDYNENVYVQWDDYSSSDVNYFNYAADGDGDGNPGMVVYEPGHYVIGLQALITVGAGVVGDNADRIIPPYIALTLQRGTYGSSFSQQSPVGITGQLQWRYNGNFSLEITPDGEPADSDLANVQGIWIGARFSMLTGPAESASLPYCYSMKIQSSRATLPWTWAPGMTFYRVSDL